jgi:zinc/manganese transport system permease protein
MDVLSFLFPPFVASLILTGIHAYLGLHVVERGVIFVDLSLAQIAALGTTIGYIVGLGLHSPQNYWMSLGFTFLGAALFALVRARRAPIPQEAIIGITYVIAAAGSILIMNRIPEGTEHLKDMLVGNILTVSWGEVGRTALLYAGIGLFHYLFRARFLRISMDPRGAEADGLSVRWWDFLFYVSFGFVVTSSVSIAGVLLVFCYLVVPSVAAMLYAERVGPRLAIGWTMGATVSALGVYLSYLFDLPTGAAIVVTFGACLILMASLRPLVVLAHRTVRVGQMSKPLPDKATFNG